MTSGIVADRAPVGSLEHDRAACSLDRALGDEPAAAPERRTETASGAHAGRSRSTWPRIAIGVAAVAIVAVAAFLFLGGDDGTLLPGGDDGPSEFSFDLRKVRAVPVGDRSAAQLQDEADQAAEAVKATMDRLYVAAFVDEDAWGSYDDAFALFQGPAVDGAREDVDALTLGATAADDYEGVADPAGTLEVTVLTNERDAAVTAIALVRFHADAELSAGGSSRVTSEGSFFLRPTDDGWLIFGYRVDREAEAAASPSPTGEASP